MKKKIALLIIISLLIITAFSITAVSSPSEYVDIFVNYVKFVVNGETVNISNLLYDSKTYVSIRDMSDMLGINLDWDSATNTVTLKVPKQYGNSAQAPVRIFLYILSKALEYSGVLLLAQIIFGRMKKDFYFMKKFSSSNTGLKRLVYTGSTARIGFYFVISGILLGFPAAQANPSMWIKIILIPLLILIFWFLGLCAANSISKREYSETVEE